VVRRSQTNPAEPRLAFEWRTIYNPESGELVAIWA
jgi:hypothetical protein